LLKKYITQGGFKNDFETNLKLVEALTAISGQVSWRSAGIVPKVKEVWIDVIENTNLLLSKTGEVIKSKVMGTVFIKSNQSGWPECKFGMNDKLQLYQNGEKIQLQKESRLKISDFINALAFLTLIKTAQFPLFRLMDFFI
jgi:hypothetical protein